MRLPPVYLGLLDALTELRGAPSRAALFRDGDAFRPEVASPAWLQGAIATASRGRPPWPGAVTEKVTFEVPTGSPFASLRALPPVPRAEATARVIEAGAAAVASSVRELAERFRLRWGAVHVDAAWLAQRPEEERRDVRILGGLRVDHDVSPAAAATRLGEVVVYGTQRIPQPVYDAIVQADGVVITRLGMGRCNGPGLAEDGSWKRLAKRARPMALPSGNSARRLPR